MYRKLDHSVGQTFVVVSLAVLLFSLDIPGSGANFTNVTSNVTSTYVGMTTTSHSFSGTAHQTANNEPTLLQKLYAGDGQYRLTGSMMGPEEGYLELCVGEECALVCLNIDDVPLLGFGPEVCKELFNVTGSMFVSDEIGRDTVVQVTSNATSYNYFQLIRKRKGSVCSIENKTYWDVCCSSTTSAIENVIYGSEEAKLTKCSRGFAKYHEYVSACLPTATTIASLDWKENGDPLSLFLWTRTSVTSTQNYCYDNNTSSFTVIVSNSSIRECMNRTYDHGLSSENNSFAITANSDCVKIKNGTKPCNWDVLDCPIKQYTMTTHDIEDKDDLDMLKLSDLSMCVYAWKPGGEAVSTFHLVPFTAALSSLFSDKFCSQTPVQTERDDTDRQRNTISTTNSWSTGAVTSSLPKTRPQDYGNTHIISIFIGSVTAFVVVTIIFVVLTVKRRSDRKRKERRRESGTHNSIANRTYYPDRDEDETNDELHTLSDEIYTYIDDTSQDGVSDIAPPLPSRNNTMNRNEPPLLADEYTTPADAVDVSAEHDDGTEYNRTYDDREHIAGAIMCRVCAADRRKLSECPDCEEGVALLSKTATESGQRQSVNLIGYDSSNVASSQMQQQCTSEVTVPQINQRSDQKPSISQVPFINLNDDCSRYTLGERNPKSLSSTSHHESAMIQMKEIPSTQLPSLPGTSRHSLDSGTSSYDYQDRGLNRKSVGSSASSSQSVTETNALDFASNHSDTIPNVLKQEEHEHTSSVRPTLARFDSYEDTEALPNDVRRKDSYEDTEALPNGLKRIDSYEDPSSNVTKPFIFRAKPPKRMVSSGDEPLCLHNISDLVCAKLGIKIVPAEGSDYYILQPTNNKRHPGRRRSTSYSDCNLTDGACVDDELDSYAKEERHRNDNPIRHHGACSKAWNPGFSEQNEYDTIGNSAKKYSPVSGRIYDHLSTVHRDNEDGKDRLTEKFPFVPFVEGCCARRYSF